jgi:hypothetical protein
MISDSQEGSAAIYGEEDKDRNKHVAARGLAVSDLAWPRQPRFHRLSESRGLRSLAATPRPQPICSARCYLALFEFNLAQKYHFALRAPAGVQRRDTTGQILKGHLGETGLTHHFPERFLIGKTKYRIRKILVSTARAAEHSANSR